MYIFIKQIMSPWDELGLKAFEVTYEADENLVAM